MRRPSTDVFELIHSMSKSEKRHFKIWASKQANSQNGNILQLYDFLNQQKKYDEGIIHQKFKNTSISKQLAVLKNQLYYLLLDSLIYKRTSYSKLLHQLQRLQILSEKSLPRQKLKLLNKVTKQVEKEGLVEFLPMLYVQKQKLLNNQSKTPQLEEIEAEQQIFEAQTQTLIVERRLHSLVLKLNFFRNHSEKIATHQEELLKIQEQILKLQREHDLSLVKKVQSNRLLSQVADYLSLGIPEQLKYIQQNVNLFQSESIRNKLGKDEYLYTLRNVTWFYLRLQNFEGAKQELEKIHQLFYAQKNSKRWLILHLPRYFDLGLYTYISLHDAIKTEELIAQIKVNLSSFGTKFNAQQIIHVYNNIAVYYYFRGNYKTSSHWFEALLNHFPNLNPNNLQSSTAFFNLLNHVSLKNYEVMEYLVKQTEKQIDKWRPVGEVEKLSFTFFLQLANAPTTSLKTILQDFSVELQELMQQNVENQTLAEHYYLLEWIQAQLKQKTIWDLL